MLRQSGVAVCLLISGGAYGVVDLDRDVGASVYATELRIEAVPQFVLVPGADAPNPNRLVANTEAAESKRLSQRLRVRGSLQGLPDTLIGNVPEDLAPIVAALQLTDPGLLAFLLNGFLRVDLTNAQFGPQQSEAPQTAVVRFSNGFVLGTQRLSGAGVGQTFAVYRLALCAPTGVVLFPPTLPGTQVYCEAYSPSSDFANPSLPAPGVTDPIVDALNDVIDLTNGLLGTVQDPEALQALVEAIVGECQDNMSPDCIDLAPLSGPLSALVDALLQIGEGDPPPPPSGSEDSPFYDLYLSSLQITNRDDAMIRVRAFASEADANNPDGSSARTLTSDSGLKTLHRFDSAIRVRSAAVLPESFADFAADPSPYVTFKDGLKRAALYRFSVTASNPARLDFDGRPLTQISDLVADGSRVTTTGNFSALVPAGFKLTNAQDCPRPPAQVVSVGLTSLQMGRVANEGLPVAALPQGLTACFEVTGLSRIAASSYVPRLQLQARPQFVIPEIPLVSTRIRLNGDILTSPYFKPTTGFAVRVTLSNTNPLRAVPYETTCFLQEGVVSGSGGVIPPSSSISRTLGALCPQLTQETQALQILAPVMSGTLMGSLSITDRSTDQVDFDSLKRTLGLEAVNLFGVPQEFNDPEPELCRLADLTDPRVQALCDLLELP